MTHPPASTSGAVCVLSRESAFEEERQVAGISDSGNFSRRELSARPARDPASPEGLPCTPSRTRMTLRHPRWPSADRRARRSKGRSPNPVFL